MADESKFFYANSVEIQASTYDITLKLLRTGAETKLMVGAAAGTSTQSPPVILDVLSVSMSPTLAKALFLSIAQGLLAYEEATGAKIHARPDVEAALNVSLAKFLKP